jgi:hypothetical protein
MSVTIDELADDDDDPRLEKLSYEAQTELQKQADERAAPPARPRRASPRGAGVPKAEPLPPVLLEVREACEAWWRQKPRRTPADHDYIDFRIHSQPDVSFISGWTQNTGHEAEFYVFGADGAGGGVAFWLVKDAPLAKQPVVYIGSEGEGSVRPVAKDLPDFLELLAAGLGPSEAPYPRSTAIQLDPLQGVRAILHAHFPSHVSRSPVEIVNEATQKSGTSKRECWSSARSNGFVSAHAGHGRAGPWGFSDRLRTSGARHSGSPVMQKIEGRRRSREGTLSLIFLRRQRRP